MILTGIFIAALMMHFGLATRNWSAGFMPGHEFRQAQTALTSYYIDKDNNFGLLYETPILGKPWVGLLLEVPIYEWSVVGLSRTLGCTQLLAARTISLASFYLLLPALYLLLGRFGLPRPRRLLLLALVLCCPVYIFYSRAFLMDPMALMACGWFLWSYVEMMARRRWPWFLVATVAGTAAALIKSATLAIWLVPAATYTAWQLWRNVRSKSGWGAFAQTVFWGLAGVTVPLGMLKLWINLTDPIKAAHASAWIFTSKNLSEGNWGLVNFGARFSGSTWATLMERWSEAIMPPWLLLLALVGLLIMGSKQWRRIAGVGAVFFLAQFMFPFAYAYQDYYFYSCAVFLLIGLGFGLLALLDSKLPCWGCWLLLAVLPAAMLQTYARDYYPQQMVQSNGGFAFTEALREFTPKESVIIVAGADWAAMVPFYSQRRALMIRNGLETDPAYLKRAFADLANEDVSALVLIWGQRKDTALRDLAVRMFDLDPAPTFSHSRADVYCNKRYSNQVKEGLRNRGYYGGDIRVATPAQPPPVDNDPFRISPGLAKSMFDLVSPAPIRGRFSFGYGKMPCGKDIVMNAQPDSDLWLRPPHAATHIEWDFGMFDGSWTRTGDKTDGVEMIITALVPGRTQREIFRRRLDPVSRPKDRGRQQVSISYYPRPGEMLKFSTEPYKSYSYDWSYWAKIVVK